MTMFLKPFRIKSNTQMKGSDKKKLKVSLKKVFPVLSDKDLDALLPTKNEIIISKVYTFAGDSVLFYVHGKNTVFFELEKDKIVYPTVYTLWKYPKLVPSVTTWPPVMEKIANGAHLMLPGIIINDEKGMKAYCDGKLKKGDSMSVNLVNNIAPIAVGTAHLSSEDMYMAARRGKGVNILHFYGDQLWAAGTREQIPDLGPPDMAFLSKEAYEDEGSDAEESYGINEDSATDSHNKAEECVDDLTDHVGVTTISDNPGEICDKGEEKAVSEVAENIAEDSMTGDSRSPQEVMDELLLNSFLQAWKTTAKKAELPMLTSNFFRLHMMGNCPPDKNLDVKKSSYKKLSKFLGAMEKNKVIKIKELQKGVESIVSVDMEHEKIKHFRVMKYEKPPTKEDEPATVVLPCDKKYEPPKVTELHTVTANVLQLFKQYNLSKGSGFTGQEVKKLLTDYAKTNSLQVESNKGLVKLNPILAEIVLAKGENNVVEMKWEELQKRVISKMSNGYSLEFPGQPPMTYKGQLEPVELSTATRSGNKKITLVNNLDVYKIDPAEFSHKCQVGVAASTSFYPAPNRKSGTEVMIQGNQVDFANKLLLEEYRIPKKYIKGVENAPKKKK